MIFGENLTVALRWEAVRGLRDKLLLESDWTQLQDSVVDKQAWELYRKNLRDIPQNFQSPELIVWPTKP